MEIVAADLAVRLIILSRSKLCSDSSAAVMSVLQLFFSDFDGTGAFVYCACDDLDCYCFVLLIYFFAYYSLVGLMVEMWNFFSMIILFGAD